MEHVRQADEIMATCARLIESLRSAALDVHDEIERLYTRIEQLELMHHDPASHGRHLDRPPHNLGS